MTGKIRGFDSPDLSRKDTLIRTATFEIEIQERARTIKEIKSQPLHADGSGEEEDDECE